MKISIMFLIRESFPLQVFMESLLINFPREYWELKVDENQHNVFNQREFSLKFFMES